MSTLERAIAHIFGAEGGYVDHPADRGGRTVYGICERAHPAMWEHGAPTFQQAREFYRDLWEKCGSDDIARLGETKCLTTFFEGGIGNKNLIILRFSCVL